MTNQCYNVVQFDGDNTKIMQLKELFSTATMTEFPNGKYSWSETDELRMHFQHMEIEEDVFRFQTLFVPNLAELKKLADRYLLSFTLFFFNLEKTLYGQAVYREASLSVFTLHQQDFSAPVFNHATKSYAFEGRQYQSEYEIYELLLQRKIDAASIPPSKNNINRNGQLTKQQRRVAHDKLLQSLKRKFSHLSNQQLIDRANSLPDFKWDDEEAELQRRKLESNGRFQYQMQVNRLVIVRDEPL